MGEMAVPADAYYGASTQRAVLNFPISGQPLPPRFLRALGMVKRASAQANRELGLLPRRRARAIAAASQEVVEGKLDDQFPIDVYQTGRTHLQDATPIGLGQEFKGYAGQIEESIRRAHVAIDELSRVPLGGTAVGTGINSHPQFARIVTARLAKETRIPVKEAVNHFHAQATLDVLVAPHGALRTIATSLWKIGSDIRLMGTGPIAGLGELRLPETQPGSSIMPGKVNPVIVESLLMVIARVYGND